ncbi:MAG: Asp23/Gls24 family envelope stress response protein [Firmicutes bacterium]|nr:Asp23/Gls24 family envelope stress response protein [Bacillota bacterium]
MVDTEERIAEETLEGSSAGSVKIAADVVATIAGLAAAQVDGIAGMSGGVVGGIAEMLGRKNLTKGIKVEIKDQDAIIDILTIVEYGVAIADVAANVQKSVKDAVETMTGLNCPTVNIHVQGVTFPEGTPTARTDD